MTGIGRGNVPRTIARLERLGLLSRQGRAGTVNFYTVIFDPNKPEALAPVGIITGDDRGVISDDGGVSSPEMQSVISNDALNRPEQTNEHTVNMHRPAVLSARARARGDAMDGASSEFETFWRIYPSRRPHSNPRKPAQLKFAAAVKRGVDPADIIRGAENYQAAIDSAGTDPRYVAQAVTWLNQERWNDHRDAPEPPRLRVGMN